VPDIGSLEFRYLLLACIRYHIYFISLLRLLSLHRVEQVDFGIDNQVVKKCGTRV